MKRLRCDHIFVSVPCSFEAEGFTSAEVKQKLFAHALDVHLNRLSRMTEEEKVAANRRMDERLIDA